jgi:hypothetical protein
MCTTFLESPQYVLVCLSCDVSRRAVNANLSGSCKIGEERRLRNGEPELLVPEHFTMCQLGPHLPSLLILLLPCMVTLGVRIGGSGQELLETAEQVLVPVGGLPCRAQQPVWLPYGVTAVDAVGVVLESAQMHVYGPMGGE